MEVEATPDVDIMTTMENFQNANDEIARFLAFLVGTCFLLGLVVPQIVKLAMEKEEDATIKSLTIERSIKIIACFTYPIIIFTLGLVGYVFSLAFPEVTIVMFVILLLIVFSGLIIALRPSWNMAKNILTLNIKEYALKYSPKLVEDNAYFEIAEEYMQDNLSITFKADYINRYLKKGGFDKQDTAHLLNLIRNHLDLKKKNKEQLESQISGGLKRVIKSINFDLISNEAMSILEYLLRAEETGLIIMEHFISYLERAKMVSYKNTDKSVLQAFVSNVLAWFQNAEYEKMTSKENSGVPSGYVHAIKSLIEIDNKNLDALQLEACSKISEEISSAKDNNHVGTNPGFLDAGENLGIRMAALEKFSSVVFPEYHFSAVFHYPDMAHKFNLQPFQTSNEAESRREFWKKELEKFKEQKGKCILCLKRMLGGTINEEQCKNYVKEVAKTDKTIIAGSCSCLKERNK